MLFYNIFLSIFSNENMKNAKIGWNAMIGYDGNMERYVKNKFGKCCREVYTIFCDPFLDFWGKSHVPEVYTIFLWSIFGLWGKKAQKC